jgi:hypothetical protein
MLNTKYLNILNEYLKPFNFIVTNNYDYYTSCEVVSINYTNSYSTIPYYLMIEKDDIDFNNYDKIQESLEIFALRMLGFSFVDLSEMSKGFKYFIRKKRVEYICKENDI